jgi:hypothetical protein
MIMSKYQNLRLIVNAVAVACCLVAFVSCDKTDDTVPSKVARKVTFAKDVLPPKAQHIAALDSVIQKLRNQEMVDWGVRNEALELVMQLGEEREISAIPSLLNGLLLIQPFSINNIFDHDSYPCMTALVKIGEPAVPQIEAHFLSAVSPVERLLLIDTLVRIKGATSVAGWLEALPADKRFLFPDQVHREFIDYVLSQRYLEN